MIGTQIPCKSGCCVDFWAERNPRSSSPAHLSCRVSSLISTVSKVTIRDIGEICRDPQGRHADVSSQTVGPILASSRSATQHGPPRTMETVAKVTLRWVFLRIMQKPRPQQQMQTRWMFAKTFWCLVQDTTDNPLAPVVRHAIRRTCDRREVTMRFGEEGVGHAQCCVQAHGSRVACTSTDPSTHWNPSSMGIFRTTISRWVDKGQCTTNGCNSRCTVWRMTLRSPQPSGRTPKARRNSEEEGISEPLLQRVIRSVQPLCTLLQQFLTRSARTTAK